MRFLDDRSIRRPWLEVYLDGTKLARCFEALAGENGLAVIAAEPIHGCRACLSGPCMTVLRGRIELRSAPPVVV